MLEDNLGSLLRSGEFHSTADRNRPDRAGIVGTHTYLDKRDGDEIKLSGESLIRATATRSTW